MKGQKVVTGAEQREVRWEIYIYRQMSGHK